MPPSVYVKPEVTDEPMEDAADLALSDEAVKPEPSTVEPQPPWTGPAPPQQACESQFQLKMPPSPFPPRQAEPPQSVNCSAPSTGSVAGYYNPGTQAPDNRTSEEKQHQLQDYHMQLFLLEQQNKKRLQMARQERDATMIPQKQEDQSPSANQEQEAPKASPSPQVQNANHAIQDFHYTSSPAELKNKEQILQERREQDAMPIPRNQDQLRLAIRQKEAQMVKQDFCIRAAQERLVNAKRGRDAMSIPHVQQEEASSEEKQGHALEYYGPQLRLLEQQNKNRMMVCGDYSSTPQKQEDQSSSAKQEQNAMPTPTVQQAETSTQQEKSHALQDHQMQLMLLEQCKKRRAMAKQKQDAMASSPKQKDNTAKQVEPDYQRHLRLLEQENKKRLMMARQEQDAAKEQPKQAVNSSGLSEEEYKRQLILLEEEGRKRLQEAREYQDTLPIPVPGKTLGPAPPTQPSILSKMDEEVAALERYNKKRMALAQRDYYGSPIPTEQRTKLLAKWEADYQQQVQDAAKPAEERQSQGKPLANWEGECFMEIHRATRPPQSCPSPPPPFVDWEAQARAHLGLGAKDTLSPENQKKVDDIIKQKYQQVWGVPDKKEDGQKPSDPPVIQTYQEQLRAQKMTQNPNVGLSPKQLALLQRQIERLQNGPGPFYKRPNPATNGESVSASQTASVTGMRQFTAAEIDAVRNHPSGKMLHLKDDQIRMMLHNKQMMKIMTQPQQTPLDVQTGASESKTGPALVNSDLPKPEQNKPSIEQQAAARFPKNPAAKEDYEAQLRLLKQQNERRQQFMANALAQQEAFLKQGQNPYHQQTQVLQSHQAASSQGTSALQDYETQMRILEQQNRKRLSMADQKQQSKKRMMSPPTAEKKESELAQSSNSETSTQSAASNNCCCGIKSASSSCFAASNSDNPVKRVSDYPEASRGHSLQDYQMQLKQLQQWEQTRNIADMPSIVAQAMSKPVQAFKNGESAQLAVSAQQSNNLQSAQKRMQIEMEALQRQAQAAQRQAQIQSQAQAMRLQQELQRQRYVQQYKIENAEKGKAKEESSSWSTLQKICPYGLGGPQHPATPNQMVLSLPHEQCPYGLARWQHPSQQSRALPMQPSFAPNAWTSQPLDAHPSYSPFNSPFAVPGDPVVDPAPPPLSPLLYSPLVANVKATGPFSSKTNPKEDTYPDLFPGPGYSTPYLPPLSPLQYSQPAPNGKAKNKSTPIIDLTEGNKASSSATVVPSSSKTEPEEDIYSAPTEASEDSDWSRLGTPEGDEDFVVVEHGALPIRSAYPQEQS